MEGIEVKETREGFIMTKENKTYIIVPYIDGFEKARYLELKLKIHLGLEEI